MRLIDADKITAKQIEKAVNEFWKVYAVRQLIDKQPTVEKFEDKWIPCSERLPEDGQTVLITLKGVSGNVVVTRTYWKVLKKTVWQGNDGVAWMPLPKPYEVQKNDD